MDTCTSTLTWHHTVLHINTRRTTEFVDITVRIEQFVRSSGIRVGTVNVQTSHTTTGIVVNEHEPLLLADFVGLLERTVPRSLPFEHDDLSRRRGVPADEPTNGVAHCRALLLPTSVSLNVVESRLVLGRWQRVFLVELDRPRIRQVSLVVTGESAR